MRATGLVDDVGRRGAHDHVCWAFDEPAGFREQALAFLADGLRRGLLVRYIGSGDVAALQADVRPLADLSEAERPGAVDAVSIDETYGADAVVDPAAQVATYADAAREALAAGFRGLRVAADCTALVRTPGQLDAFARYELLVDRHMAAQPFSAMCAFDRSELGDGVVDQLACLHPRANADAAFRLHGSATATAALGGELDLATEERFALALGRADLEPVDGEIVIDATGLDYVGQRALFALAAVARHRRCTVVLRTRRPGPARLVAVLGIPGVRVERPPSGETDSAGALTGHPRLA